MSRKHYVAIAAAVRNLPAQTDREAMVAALVPVFEADNPAFDRVRFEVAAGVS